MNRTIVALFDDTRIAQRAFEDLLNYGFDRKDISFARSSLVSEADEAPLTDADVADSTLTGAGVGAALGGLAGLVVGVAALAIPGIGPIVAAGPLATALGGAAAGAATGGVAGALADAGIPKTEAEYYTEGIRRGGTLLSVTANESQVIKAIQVLNRHSPIDMDQRVAEWRSTGWTGFDQGAGRHPAADTGHFDELDREFRSDWQARYASSGGGYERYQTAYRFGWEARRSYGARNWKNVEGELRAEWQRIHPNDAWEDFGDAVRTGWARFKGAPAESIRDAERAYDRATSPMSQGFDVYYPDFHANWEKSFGRSGYGYERYRPAYRYGYDLATERRFQGRQWNEIEAEARRDWEMRHPSDAWDEFRDAVRHAWQRVRADVKDAQD